MTVAKQGDDAGMTVLYREHYKSKIKGVRAVLKLVIPVVYSQRYLAGVLENHRYPIKISRV